MQLITLNYLLTKDRKRLPGNVRICARRKLNEQAPVRKDHAHTVALTKEWIDALADLKSI